MADVSVEALQIVKQSLNDFRTDISGMAGRVQSTSEQLVQSGLSKVSKVQSDVAESEDKINKLHQKIGALENKISQISADIHSLESSNFLTRIHQDSAHSFSDLIDATTNGELYGRYGHSREYWQRPGNLQAEAFAHFFEASMGGGWKLELLSNLFPTAFAIFRDKIESILPEERIHILERGR